MRAYHEQINITGDAIPETLAEVKSMLYEQGDCVIGHIERKFSLLVLAVHPGAYEVYQLPIDEEAADV